MERRRFKNDRAERIVNLSDQRLLRRGGHLFLLEPNCDTFTGSVKL